VTFREDFIVESIKKHGFYYVSLLRAVAGDVRGFREAWGSPYKHDARRDVEWRKRVYSQCGTEQYRLRYTDRVFVDATEELIKGGTW